MKQNPRKEAALSAKLFMAQNGITIEDIAKGALLTCGTVRNIINGGNQSTMGRQRVATFLGKSFWPGIEPARPGLAPKQRNLLERTADAAEALAQRFEEAGTPETREQVLAGYRELLTDEVLDLVTRTDAIPLALNLRISRALMPFFHASTTPEQRELPPGSVRVSLVKSTSNEVA